MTITTQAIETKFLAPTNSRGARIKARAWARSITTPYDYALSAEQNHRAAAMALVETLAWHGQWAQGGNAAGNGYFFVNYNPK